MSSEDFRKEPATMDRRRDLPRAAQWHIVFLFWGFVVITVVVAFV